jgi:Acetyl-CoA dehydrogenase C-terminal like
VELAAAAHERRARGHADAGFIEAKLAAAQYWIATELPRLPHLAQLCRSGESSYVALDPAAF